MIAQAVVSSSRGFHASSDGSVVPLAREKRRLVTVRVSSVFIDGSYHRARQALLRGQPTLVDAIGSKATAVDVSEAAAI